MAANGQQASAQPLSSVNTIAGIGELDCMSVYKNINDNYNVNIYMTRSHGNTATNSAYINTLCCLIKYLLLCKTVKLTMFKSGHYPILVRVLTCVWFRWFLLKWWSLILHCVISCVDIQLYTILTICVALLSC